MNRILYALTAVAAAAVWLAADRPAVGQGPQPPQGGIPRGLLEAMRGDQGDRRYEDFDKVVKGGKEYEGFFRLHHKEDHVYAEILPHQFEKPFLCPIAIARGMSMGGFTLNDDEQWVLLFRRAGDRVLLVRRNVRFTARGGSPMAKAVETTYHDSVLLALRVVSINQMRQSVLIDLNQIFMTDFAQLNLGMFDASRSTWSKVKAFQRNIELEVTATFSGRPFGGGFHSGGDSVIDSRGTTVVIHYGLCELPDFGYQARLADDRVGHFINVVKDFSSDSRDTSFVRYVNRWRLEKADSSSKLSPPKKPIVFWIEKSVPDEYRTYVREGILEWNKAFEKIGYRDAIEVRQQVDDIFDPEDSNFNTFRWITTDQGFAMGPRRTNPLTGEIFDADIIFDASMVRYWKREYQLMTTGSGPAAMEEPASPIRALKQGWGLLDTRQALLGGATGWNEARQADQATDLLSPLRAIRQGICQCGPCMKTQIGLASMALEARGMIKAGEGAPEELIGQAIKETVMHEVGHALGLRHNFKASTMLKNEELHDTNITRKKGLVGSVMDYNPVNLAPKGVKQGDYFTTTIGPYDYWAIEYAYKPIGGGTDGEYEKLKEIANRGAQPGMDYGTDEDLYGASDPLINQWDLGNDPMKFAKERMLLADELLKGLSERVVQKGEGYQRVRHAFTMLLQQYGDAAHLVSSHVGGVYLHRDHRGDPSGRDPFRPVAAAKQRDALRFLQEQLLTDRPFQFSPDLLRRLAADRWVHWGNEGTMFGNVEYPIYQRVLATQRVALDHLFDPEVLARVQNSALKVEKEEQPLTVAEIFRCLTDGIWTETPDGPMPKDTRRTGPASIVRRNLQREHLRNLSGLVLGSRTRSGGFDLISLLRGAGSRSAPPDARSLARMHLRELSRRIDRSLTDREALLEDTTRAHLEECKERIAKVLAASMQAND